MTTGRPQPLPTRDPFGGGEVVVSELTVPATGVTIRGTFSLGWMGRLSPEQLDFLGLLLQRRNNLQKLATDLGVAYNTVRGRFESIVEAVGGRPDDGGETEPGGGTSDIPRARVAGEHRKDLLRRLAAGDVTVDEARSILED